MKIAVVGGAGAIGAVFASSLHAAGEDVAILDVSPDAIAAVNRDGLVVTPTGEAERVYRIHATANATEIGGCDVVIVLTKAHHTRAAMTAAAPLVRPDTTIATFQNGWGNAETLAEAFPPERIVMGVTYHGATVLAPGRIAHTLNGATYLGPFQTGAPMDRAQAIGDALARAGNVVTVTATVATEMWKKLVLNAAGLPVSALTRLPSGAMGQREDLLRIIEQLMREAAAIAQAKGIPIDADERIAAVRDVLSRSGPGKPSMLQDVEARRKTEIEVVNGAIVREAEALGMDAPLHRTMVALIQGLESGWAS